MNQKTIVLGLALLFMGSIFAQEKRTIKVIVPNKTDEVFITGNQESLANWEPGTLKMHAIGRSLAARWVHKRNSVCS